jgi:hypothetical protein
MKRETSFCNIVSNPKMHMCAQYRHIITNYTSILAIILLIWPKSHGTSNMIAHFVKIFLWCLQFSKFNTFPCNYNTLWHHKKVSRCLDYFLNSYACLKLYSKQRAWRFIARSWVSLDLRWISDKTTYCGPKNDFYKKSWALYHIHVVQT